MIELGEINFRLRSSNYGIVSAYQTQIQTDLIL